MKNGQAEMADISRAWIGICPQVTDTAVYQYVPGLGLAAIG